jgi:hypothetical protein
LINPATGKAVTDPLLTFIEQQQPRDTFNRVQYVLIDEYARNLQL